MRGWFLISLGMLAVWFYYLPYTAGIFIGCIVLYSIIRAWAEFKTDFGPSMQPSPYSSLEPEIAPLAQVSDMQDITDDVVVVNFKEGR